MFKKERRRFRRLNPHYLLKYRIVGKNQILAFTRNISAGGALFHSQENLPLGCTIELWLNFPSYPKPIKTLAKVLRSKPLKKLGGYDIAVEFINIEERAQNFINDNFLKVYKFKEKGRGRYQR